MLLAAAAAGALVRVSDRRGAPTLGCCGCARLTLGSSLVVQAVSPCPDTQDNDGSVGVYRRTCVVLTAADVWFLVLRDQPQPIGQLEPWLVGLGALLSLSLILSISLAIFERFSAKVTESRNFLRCDL